MRGSGLEGPSTILLLCTLLGDTYLQKHLVKWSFFFFFIFCILAETYLRFCSQDLLETPGCPGSPWVPPGCLLGASWVPPGCLLGASWEPLLIPDPRLQIPGSRSQPPGSDSRLQDPDSRLQTPDCRLQTHSNENEAQKLFGFSR